METEPATFVVVPVKGTAGAKSRLRPPPRVARPVLALALAADTLAAAAAIPSVRLIVVTSGSGAGALAASVVPPAATLVTDPGRGLGPAITAGLAAVPGDAPAAVLLADLPALRAAELTVALGAIAAAGPDAAFVPDAAGTGTVLLGGPRREMLRPAFGSGSAVAHASDALRLDLDLPGLRRDVDTCADLREALQLGVGAATREALRNATAPTGRTPA